MVMDGGFADYGMDSGVGKAHTDHGEDTSDITDAGYDADMSGAEDAGGGEVDSKGGLYWDGQD